MEDNKYLRDTIHELLACLDPTPFDINSTTDVIMGLMGDVCDVAYKKGYKDAEDDTALEEMSGY